MLYTSVIVFFDWSNMVKWDLFLYFLSPNSASKIQIF